MKLFGCCNLLWTIMFGAHQPSFKFGGFFIIVNLVISPHVSGTILYHLTSLATHSVQSPFNEICRSIPGLTGAQQKLCEREPGALLPVVFGARIALGECQKQFSMEPWNCSTEREHLSKTLMKSTKETAFIYAITSAGVMHAITKACSAGNLTDCSCAITPDSKSPPVESQKGGVTDDSSGAPRMYKWAGCSDNIDYGFEFSQQFVDAPEDVERTRFDKAFMGNRHDRKRWRRLVIRKRVNIHNNRVGREAIAGNMEVSCRCHGVSGSCTLKSCWKTMPKFQNVALTIKIGYNKAIRVNRRLRRILRRRRVSRNQRVPKNKLLYLHKSPNYCHENPTRGVLGTKGRECKKDASDSTGCPSMCCDRGVKIKIVKEVKKCECVFQWCCKVICKTCTEFIERHYCR